EVDRILEREGPSRRAEIAPEAVEGDQDGVRVAAAELGESAVEGRLVAGADLRRFHMVLVAGERGAELDEVDLEQPNAAAVPVLQHLDEIAQEAPAVEGQEMPARAERAAPRRSRLDADERVGAEPEPGLDAEPGELGKPAARPLRPVLGAPFAIAAVRGEPERVHEVVVDPDAVALKALDLEELRQRQRFSEADVVRELVVDRPVVVDPDRGREERMTLGGGGRPAEGKEERGGESCQARREHRESPE